MTKKLKPNVLFIMTDQLRSDFLGYMGADFVRTPNLDRLASRGMVFTNCFTNSPLCAPARIGLAAGVNPGRLGALTNASYLPPHVPTFYQRFRDNGYRVGVVGKLDLAKPDPYNGRYGDRPRVYQWGFTHPEEVEGKMHAGLFPTPQGPYGFYLQDKGLYDAFYEDYQQRRRTGFSLECEDSVLPTEAFADSYIGRRAATWIDNVPEDFPWFYFVSFVGPHDPYDPPTAYAERYRGSEMPEAIKPALEGKPGWVHRRVKTEDAEKILETRRQYCASIEAIDDHIGMIMDSLERRGMLENTYIIFTSDHGEMIGDHGMYTKQVAYEPSIRIPLIIAGPNIEAGRISEALVELIDLNETSCDLVNLPPDGRLRDSLSFIHVLKGQGNQHRSDIVTCGDNFQCIRTEQYKYIHNVNDIPELYDLQNDPNETVNIAPEHPDMVKELSRKLTKRFLDHSTIR
ncbi:sulfatase [Ammoniphilus sp. YIM 78166]|uniref:sulfatase family protein n=1 Tax=Ammoniphilus sp. YIM 78166 TaxID=1644106 RepID=UPI0014307DB0|nr:sulfatase-like hydrolase/transferase [Ammoniphilus sp. YIM 78166]